MKIAVIGAGAMGSIYGGFLSEFNQVYLIDSNPKVVETVNSRGLAIEEQEQTRLFHPKAILSSEGIPAVDLIILFVKALYSRQALMDNRGMIGPNTYVMTLQNGSGHEDILKEFVPMNRIIIGTTQDNGAVLDYGHIRRGGMGNTDVGMLKVDDQAFLPRLKACFEICGFHVNIHENIQQLIWNKLFTNVSLSAVTAVLQVEMGFVAQNPHAWHMTCMLLKEAVIVARALGLEADEEKLVQEIRQVSLNSPMGVTSICADLRKGRKTEVDTISGSVVRAAAKLSISVPTQEFVVDMIHAMEDAFLTKEKKQL